MGFPARRIHQQISILGSLYRLADAASVAGGLVLATWAGGLLPADFVLPGTAAILIHYFVAEIGGMYRSWRGVSTSRETFASLTCWSIAALTLAGIGLAQGRLAALPQTLLIVWPLGTALCLMLTHGLLRGAQRSLWLRGLNTKGCAIVGVTDLGIQLAHNILETPELGLKL